MASQSEVKDYLAHWFQLGKRVINPGTQHPLRPQQVIQGSRFSPDMERCWAQIMEKGGEDFYLEGTDQTIAELLSHNWEILECPRCDMPLPLPHVEMAMPTCPCSDLAGWPNEEIPKPRLPIDSDRHLCQIRDRLQANHSHT